MADLRRTIDLDVDTDRNVVGVIKNATVKAFSPQQVLLRTSQILFRAQLYMGNGVTRFACPAGAAFLFGIDSDYTAGHADLVTALDADFNRAGDWAQLDPTTGRICWRAALTGPALAAALGSSPSLEAYAHLFICPSGGAYTPLAKWTVTLGNVAVDPTTATAQAGVSFATTDLLAADLAVLRAPFQGAYRLTTGGLLELWNATQSKYQAVTLTGAVGAETVVFSQGET